MFKSKKYLFIAINIILLQTCQYYAQGQDPNNDIAVTLKLDVFALDNKSRVCNDFNRTDEITICYMLTNTMERPGKIAKDVNFTTVLSNILYSPKNDIEVSSANPKDNDGDGFYLECQIDPKCIGATQKCKINSVKIDKNGSLIAKVKYLHPRETDVVYINYSSKIPKDSPTGNDIPCSDIKDCDVRFTRYWRNPLELIVSGINISNNNPLLHNWGICPTDTKYIKNNFTKENIIYYTVTQDTEFEISYNISDIETDPSSLLIKLYDIYTDENEHNISEIPIKNGKFVLNTLGNHSIEIEVFDGETNYSELWNGKIEILNITSEGYHLEAAKYRHDIKNTLLLILYSAMVLFMLIFVPQAPRMTSKQKLASIINDPIIIKFLLYITLAFSILTIICAILINVKINLQDIYKYELFVYGLALTLSIILINNDRYVFSWEDIPGKDDGRLKGFLIQRFEIDWIRSAHIEKIDNGKTIKISTGHNFIYLKLNNIEDEVILEINDVEKDRFEATMESGKLNIYNDSNKICRHDDESKCQDTEKKGPIWTICKVKYNSRDWYLAGIFSLIILVGSHRFFEILITFTFLHTIVASLLFIILNIFLRKFSRKTNDPENIYKSSFITIFFLFFVFWIYHESNQSVSLVTPFYYFRDLFIFYLFQLLLLFIFLITPIEPCIKDDLTSLASWLKDKI